MLVQNGKLAFKVSKDMVWEFCDPDEQGRWYLTMDSSLSVAFTESVLKKITGMTLYTKLQIPKQKQESEDLSAVPKEYQPYCGVYFLAGLGNINIFYKDGKLAIQTPDGNVSEWEGPDQAGMWRSVDKNDQSTFLFVKDEAGNVRTVIANVVEEYKKLE